MYPLLENSTIRIYHKEDKVFFLGKLQKTFTILHFFLIKLFWRLGVSGKVTNERNPVTNSYKEEKKRFVRKHIL